MEITKLNFAQILPDVLRDIDESLFISIDCELTGLNSGANVNPFDTQAQYYTKVKESCRQFLPIQYGICTFKFNKDSKLLESSAYNFYVFRSLSNKAVPESSFVCQASCIDFLSSNGFDFNKLFRNGIPYLNTVEEEALIKAAQEQSNEKQEFIMIPDKDRPYVEENVSAIRDFLKSEEDELIIPCENPFLRKLIYQEVEKKFDNSILMETKQSENKSRYLLVQKSSLTKEEKKQKQIDDALRKVEETLGFSKVIRHIVNSDKLVVGHNMCFDLLHTIDKFLAPLPENYEEFKQCAHGLFSKIIDTKYMSSAAPFKETITSSVLKPLLEQLNKPPYSVPTVAAAAGSQSYKIEDNKAHEAGYDAYITGLCLLSMWKHLESTKSVPEDGYEDYELLNPFLNRLFLMRLQDGLYIHFGHKDPSASRKHVFHISFPNNWKRSDITNLFEPFGNIYIAWIDATSAYVSLHRRDQASKVCRALSKSSLYTITPFAKQQESPSPAKKRKLEQENSSSAWERIKVVKETNVTTKETEKVFEEDDSWV